MRIEKLILPLSLDKKEPKKIEPEKIIEAINTAPNHELWARKLMQDFYKESDKLPKLNSSINDNATLFNTLNPSLFINEIKSRIFITLTVKDPENDPYCITNFDLNDHRRASSDSDNIEEYQTLVEESFDECFNPQSKEIKDRIGEVLIYGLGDNLSSF